MAGHPKHPSAANHNLYPSVKIRRLARPSASQNNVMQETMHIAGEQARHQMIAQQLRTWSVLDAEVLAALKDVPRERFVPAAFSGVAFADDAIPLGRGQIMLPPSLEGRILQALSVKTTDDVLDVGTGSGFLAACLGRLGAHVRSIELFADLAQTARTSLLSVSANN